MQLTRVGYPKGNVHVGPSHRIQRQSQKMAGGDVIVEDHQNGGLNPVIVGGPLGVVLAQVGSQPGRYRSGPHRPSFPLQEEGPSDSALAQNTEGVGVNGTMPVAVSEVPGGAVGRVQLHDLPPAGTGLACQGGDEPMDGGGVLDVAEQLSAAPAGHVPPVQGFSRVARRGAPSFPGNAHCVRSLRASTPSPRSVSASRMPETDTRVISSKPSRAPVI